MQAQGGRQWYANEAKRRTKRRENRLKEIDADAANHVELPIKERCASCVEHSSPCFLKKTFGYPSGRAGEKCACCVNINKSCSLQRHNVARRMTLQAILDAQAPPSSDNAPNTPQSAIPSASTSRDGLTNSTTISSSADDSVRPTTDSPMATSPAASSILTDDSTSDATFPSPNSSSSSTQPTANGSGPSRHKRTWSEANPSPDEAAPAAKAIRPSTSTNLQPTTTATDFTEHIQGEDPAFGGHILGLLARHDAALKSQKAAQTASEGLRQEVERLQGIVETRKVKEAELRNKNTGLVNEQRAAAILAKEKESTLKVSNTDLTKRLETAQEVLARTQSGLKEAVENAEKAAKEAMEKEKKEIEDGAREELEARRNTITELQRRLAEVEAQSSQYEAAITNADASRRARNEAQEELAAAKEDGYRTSNKLQEKMASLDAALIDLETSQDKLKRLKNECADQQTVKVQLAALQVKYQNIQLENRQLSNELQGVNERIAGLQAKASIADDRLLERTECEGRLATAQRTVKAQAEELKDVRERMEKSEKAEKEVRRNFNVQKAELHRLNTRNRELQGAASGHLRRVKEESGAKRENGGYRAGSGSTSTFGLSGVIDLSMDED